jgi:hypothetical protein
VPALERLYREYRDRASFYFVYVREAHPTDGRQVQANVRDKILIKSPTTIEERAMIASNCVNTLGLTMPCLVDTIDNTTQKTYQGWPARACIIGTNGVLEYISPPGPKGMNPDQIKAALKALLPEEKKP